MYCVCYIDGIQYRVKSPLHNNLISHGLCGERLPLEMGRIKKELRALKKKSLGNSCFHHGNFCEVI